MMLCDGIVFCMGVEYDNILIFDGFGVGRGMHGCFIVGFMEVLASGIGYVFGDKESGDIREECNERSNSDDFDHDRSIR
jgi:hypothetical protein